MNWNTVPESLSHAPYHLPIITSPLMFGPHRPSVLPTRSGYSSNGLSDFMRRRRQNPGASLYFPHGVGPADSNSPLMPLWRRTSHISTPCPRLPRNIWLPGTEFYCVCHSTLADFEGSIGFHPSFIHTPTGPHTSPTLQWTPPPIIQALRDVDTDSWGGIESSLHTRCDLCGGLVKEQDTQDGINSHSHFLSSERLYRMERAIMDDDWARLLHWFRRTGYTFDTRDIQHRTPLHIAILHRKEKIVQNLIKGGAFIDAQTLEGYTPLMLAVRLTDISLARLVILYGANINLHTVNGMTALGLAISQRKENMVHMLLEYHADPCGGYPLPHLHRSLWMGPERVADAIWQAGANFEVRDANGRSALCIAAKYKRTGVLMRMLPLASPKSLLHAWRNTSNAVFIVRETRRRVAALDYHILSALAAWNLPTDVERIVLDYLYKRPPQHNGARKTS